ncbi:glycosyltransferase family 2 protein [Palleronia caenipelagi]|uniref:Glycosyltransferase family 2 protein n=1 Tax=Palleronia caenipelagi TaxID=2489174 RepID=A0A547Q7T1_9RHOB|nr:glycosyltransferase family 2 protein [Palleronia caenipelagi]TRD22423.1 glycosyltransferase family 2 protein [Palleronia caenipelagi]
MSQKQPDLHQITLASVACPEGGYVLEALRLPPLDGHHENRCRIFLSADGPLAGIADSGPGLTDLTRRAVRGNAGGIVEATLSGDANPALVVGDAAVPLTLTDRQVDLLAGRDCLISFVNGEETAIVANWVRWHAEHHGVTGGLLYNRLGPAGEGADLADRLRAELAGLALCIVVVDVPAPIGHAHLPPADHPLNAPDAPGKDRMEIPDPDPWRGPLRDEVLLEHARSRFLPEATGILFLDLSDYLFAQAGDGSVFDFARSAPHHYVPVQGRRVYPWQVQQDGAPVLGDHICAPFDIKAVFSRWCAVPHAVDGPEMVWRPHRVIGAEAEVAAPHQILRCMAMKHPHLKPSEIAPKTSLREVPSLVTFVTEVLGYEPGRAPQVDSETIAALRTAPDVEGPVNVTLVTAMKNEGPFLLEWIAYHRVIGVTDFIVYTNDCTDGTDTFLQLLQDKGILQHRENPFKSQPGVKPQHAALDAAQREDVVKGAHWLMASDVDEYIAVHVGDGTLKSLFAAVGEANFISLTWRLFGNSDIEEYEDDFIIRQFTQCAHKFCNKPHQAWGFKTLYRNIDIFKKMGVHRPKGLKAELLPAIRWVNGSGKPMPQSEYRNAWRSNASTFGYDLVTLNHYAIRSVESFLVKRDRGRVNHTDRDQGLAYWFRMNHNSTEDRSIQRMIPALEEEWARLISDPEIKAAHEGCVAAHRAKIAELKARPDYAEFYEQIRSPRMRKLSRLLKHFGRNIFLAGPQAVPDWVLEKDLPDNFFFTVDDVEETSH